MSKWPVPTLGEMVDGCLGNANVASIQIGRAEDQLRDMVPGQERTLLLRALSNYRAEFEHWSNYVSYYRQRAAKEGAGTRPEIKLPNSVKKPWKPTVVPPPTPHWQDKPSPRDEDYYEPVGNPPAEIANDEIPF